MKPLTVADFEYAHSLSASDPSGAAAAPPPPPPAHVTVIPIIDPVFHAIGEPLLTIMPHLPAIISLLQVDPWPETQTETSNTSSSSPSNSNSSTNSSTNSSSNSTTSPTSASSTIPAVDRTPFGALRMKIVELILVLSRSRLRVIDQLLVQLHVPCTILQVFFRYPWHNLLHGLAENIITTALDDPESPFAAALFDPQSGNLVSAYLSAYERNTRLMAAGGMRLGYMGHLIRSAITLHTSLVQLSEEQRALLTKTPEAKACLEEFYKFVCGKLTEETNAQRGYGENTLGAEDEDEDDMTGQPHHDDDDDDDEDEDDVGFAYHHNPNPFEDYDQQDQHDPHAGDAADSQNEPPHSTQAWGATTTTTPPASTQLEDEVVCVEEDELEFPVVTAAASPPAAAAAAATAAAHASAAVEGASVVPVPVAQDLIVSDVDDTVEPEEELVDVVQPQQQ